MTKTLKDCKTDELIDELCNRGCKITIMADAHDRVEKVLKRLKEENIDEVNRLVKASSHLSNPIKHTVTIMMPFIMRWDGEEEPVIGADLDQAYYKIEAEAKSLDVYKLYKKNIEKYNEDVNALASKYGIDPNEVDYMISKIQDS